MNPISRREVLAGMTAMAATLTAGPALATVSPRRDSMTVTCFIRYQIDPYKRDQFAKYAEAWGPIIPRCGGHLIGYFLPYEGTNDIGWALISFDSLASYEIYRARLRSDPDARANFAFSQTNRFILREERTFLEAVNGTLELPSTLPPRS